MTEAGQIIINNGIDGMSKATMKGCQTSIVCPGSSGMRYRLKRKKVLDPALELPDKYSHGILPVVSRTNRAMAHYIKEFTAF